VESNLAKIRVNTLAKPIPSVLLAVRTAIRVSPDLQQLFERAKNESWSSQTLADALYIRLPEYVIEDGELLLWDAALYLADEFLQLGDKLLLISKETGQVLARLTEADIYTPAPVARETEDGETHLAQPLPRLRPELEALLIEQAFIQDRDKKLESLLASRANQTDLLKQDGDPRLLRATKGGRKAIVDRLREELPTLLLPPYGAGSVNDFLGLCTFVEDRTSTGGTLLWSSPGTAYAKILTSVVDPLTFNLRHDPFTALKRQITTQWVRSIASTLFGLAYSHWTVQEVTLETAKLDTPGFWIGSPNVTRLLHPSLPIESIGPRFAIKLQQQESVVFVHITSDSFRCESREFLDRWEVGASFEYTLAIGSPIHSFDVLDVVESGVSAELV
jgi:hypothetical protein